MRHILLLINIFLFSTTLLTSQINYDIQLSITPSLMQPQMALADLSESCFKLGMDAGVAIGTDVLDNLHVSAGLLYSRQRVYERDYSPVFNSDNKDGTVDQYASWYEDRIDLDYVGVSLQMDYSFRIGDDAIAPLVGMEWLANMSFSTQTLLIEGGEPGQSPRDIDNVPQSVIGRGVFGVQYEKRLNASSALSLTPIFKFGLSDLFEVIGNSGREVRRTRMHMYGVQLGYVHALGGSDGE